MTKLDIIIIMVYMLLKDYVYHYSQYCAVQVEAALLIENWFDQDFDDKYRDYLGEFTRLKPVFMSPTNTGIDAHPDKAVLVLTTKRNAETRNILFNEMKTLLNGRKKISKDKENALKTRLDRAAPLTDKVDFKYIEEIRLIEEEEL